MIPVSPPGQSHQCAPGIHVPVWRTQSGKGGHQIDAPGVGHLGGIIFRIPGFRDKPQLIPHPLDHRTAHKDRALQGVLHTTIKADGNSGQQAVFTSAQLLSGVHQQKATSPVGVFCFSGVEAALAKEGGLLVSRNACNGHLHPLQIGKSVHLAGGTHLGQHLHRNVQTAADLLVPAQILNVKEHGAAGVGVVGNMRFSSGQLPHQPGVHGSEQQLPGSGPLPSPFHMVQNPLELGGGEVGVDEQAGVLLDVVRKGPFRLQLLTQRCGTAALPDDGVVDRAAGGFVPDDGSLPLVGDANGGHLGRGNTGLSQHLCEHRRLAGPDLHGVLLHPAGLGVDLGKFPLGHAHDVLLPVKEDTAAAGGPLVQGDDILLHSAPPERIVFSIMPEKAGAVKV